MQHVLFNDIPPCRACLAAGYRARVCVITNSCLLRVGRVLRNVLSDSYRCAFRDPPHRTLPISIHHPPPHLSSSPLTSRLSRRQPVKNDRGVSLLGQWQIEYILASSEKRVLRFVYCLSCYAKDRNFCRLRIRRIATFILRARQLLRRHYIIARRYTIITVNNSKEIEGEREKAGIAFVTKIASTYFESQEQFLRLRR